MSKKKKSLEELLEETIVQEDEQPYEIPENWVWTILGNINEAINPNIEPGKFPNEKFILYSVPSFESGSPEIIYGREIKSSKQIVETGDVLISKINPRINRVWVVGKHNNSRVIASTEWIIIKNKKISSKFLSYYFKSPEFRNKLCSNVSGVGGSLTRARPKEVMQYNFPLAPIKEQNEIVNKIEILFAKLDEAKQLIEEAKETFELRRAAIIKSLIDSSISKVPLEKLDYKKLNEVYKIFGGGTPSKSKKEYWNGDVNWFSAKDIKTVYLENSMDKITELGVENSSAKLANKGSIVVVTRSGILQHSLPIAKLLVDATVNQDLKVFSSNNQLLNDFLLWYLQANEKYLLKEYSKSGTTVNSIEFDRFKTLKIPVLSDEVLKELLFNIEVAIKKEKESYDFLNQEIDLNLLKNSILLKAFKGEIGTNDSTDEAAIELLKSILQEKL